MRMRDTSYICMYVHAYEIRKKLCTHVVTGYYNSSPIPHTVADRYASGKEGAGEVRGWGRWPTKGTDTHHQHTDSCVSV